MLKEKVISEVLAHRESGVLEVEGDYELDSLAKLEVIAFLEGIKPGLLDNRFNDIADAQTLDAIIAVFTEYQVVEAAA